MTELSVKILVVDDEPAIRKLLRIGLAVEGCSVIEAVNAKDAIEKVRTERPDLILLDLGLPDMQGHDLLAKWRNALIELPMRLALLRHWSSVPMITLRSLLA